MIALVAGIVLDKRDETILIQTDGGVGYEVTVPLGVHERLPPEGARWSLHTELVIREDAWTLYGFDRPGDRTIFQRLLTASGFGPRLALSLLSTLGPDRTVRSIQSKDVAALSTVTGIGRKKAERLILELADKFKDVAVERAPAGAITSAAEAAARALVSLGYSPAGADDAVRKALAEEPGAETGALVRRALQMMTTSKGGRG